MIMLKIYNWIKKIIFRSFSRPCKTVITQRSHIRAEGRGRGKACKDPAQEEKDTWNQCCWWWGCCFWSWWWTSKKERWVCKCIYMYCSFKSRNKTWEFLLFWTFHYNLATIHNPNFWVINWLCICKSTFI